MPLILPRRSLLSYPAGTAPGVDPTHPAARKLALSAVASGSSFIDSLRGIKAGSVSVLGTSVDETIGRVTMYSAGVSWVTFPSLPFLATTTARAAGVTLAGIFRSTSAADTQTVVGVGGSFDSLLFYLSDGNSVGWFDGAQHTVSLNVVTNQPYFLVASANTAGVNFVLKNLATGQVQSAVFTGAITLVALAATDVTLGADVDGGGGDSMGGSMAAGMMNLTYMPMQQLLEWARDPWSFWYPPAPPAQRKVSYSYSFAPTTTTTGGARVLQRFNKSKLAYPAGAVPGFDPAHPAARNTIMSGVAVPGRNMINLVKGAPLTYSGVGGTFPQYVMDGEVGPSVTHTANGNQSLQFSMPNATLNAVTCAYILRPTGSNAFQVLTMSVGGFYMALQSLVPVFSQGADLTAGFTLTSGVPYFLAASGPFGIGTGNFNFVARRLDTGQLFQSSTATNNAISDGTTLNIGNVGGTANHPDQVNLAAAMWAPDLSLSLSQLLDWSKAPWEFWFPNKPLNLTSTAAASSSFLAAWAQQFNYPVIGTGTY